MHVLFPGSFDPPHLGHADLIARSARLFTRLTVAIATNPDKKSFLPLARRLDLLRALAAPHANVDIASYDGATAAFARARGCVALLRGLRDGRDLTYEAGMAAVNREAGGVDTVFLVTAPAVSHLSSQLVRSAIAAGMPVDALVPPAVAAALNRGGA